MTDRLYPLALESMATWIRDELKTKDSIFGIGRNLFFTPALSDPFRTQVFRQALDTPVGVAAGPHTQMAQNIVAAWLCGARFIELKTIQTLDELEVTKPCIDMEDAGYNVEWSQELRIHESLNEYVHAWILIHLLHRILGFPGDNPGVIFNMSVGYNMEGILKPNVQHFLQSMRDASSLIEAARPQWSRVWPELRDIAIPTRLSDNVTLSTMHGCPPEDIGTICRYMLEQQGLHTYVKLNPTLLGPDRLRAILNSELGFDDITVPDEAFGHDITFDDAVKLIRVLRGIAASNDRSFGVKLSNTLEVINHRKVFPAKEKQMYMSGRPLHAVTVHVALRLQEVFYGELDISFAGGADTFNYPALIACGMKTVTVCSDLLRSGGYTRLVQYHQCLRDEIAAKGAGSINDYILASTSNYQNDLRKAAFLNLSAYAMQVVTDAAYKADTYERAHTKSNRKLGPFDCIKAPCTEVCPVEQRVPQYMRFVKAGRIDDAARVVKRDNTMPAVLGRACHHPCHTRCVRTHLDQPVQIREVKRFIMDHAKIQSMPAFLRKERVAIIGAGPCGLAATDFLSRAGYPVTLLDARNREGGMISSSIPGYRASDEALRKDIAFLVERGIHVRYGVKAGIDFTIDDLRAEGFAAIVIAIGAQQAGTIDTRGETVTGIWDSLSFLRACRDGHPPVIGQRVGVIGGGDVAMDCARTAWRLGAEHVSVIYRRTRHEMPAQYDEVHGLIDEKIPVRELLSPKDVLAEHGRLTGLRCTVMELGDADESGRRSPRPVDGKVEEIPLDSLIVAINQSGDFKWLEEHHITLNKNGYIEVNPETCETCKAGIYAGGDAIGEGPATIVKALGDGKRIARAIRISFEGPIPPEPAVNDLAPSDRATLQYRRAWRTQPQIPSERPADQRRDFREVVTTMDIGSARLEAARCLDCDVLCSYCVGVCPNLALFTYKSSLLTVSLPAGRIESGRWLTTGNTTFAVTQPYQVAVYADFCNECGNCTTFCPSAGRPHRDKPRIYRQRAEFEKESDNAFMLLPHDGVTTVYGRYQGATHQLTINNELTYETPGVRVQWKKDWTLVFIEVRENITDADSISLEPAVHMAALASGLLKSMPFLPLAKEFI
jgi:putative selenate reductase